VGLLPLVAIHHWHDRGTRGRRCHTVPIFVSIRLVRNIYISVARSIWVEASNMHHKRYQEPGLPLWHILRTFFFNDLFSPFLISRFLIGSHLNFFCNNLNVILRTIMQYYPAARMTRHSHRNQISPFLKWMSSCNSVGVTRHSSTGRRGCASAGSVCSVLDMQCPAVVQGKLGIHLTPFSFPLHFPSNAPSWAISY